MKRLQSVAVLLVVCLLLAIIAFGIVATLLGF
jgi:hypothetical protein